VSARTVEVIRNKKEECAMTRTVHPALKHGGYAGMSVLPGEDAAAFEKLEHDLFDELSPSGPSEEEIVMTIARFIWRKQNLGTYRKAEVARDRVDSIEYNARWAPSAKQSELELEEKIETQSREELGEAYELVELEDLLTHDNLIDELDLIDRLDRMIDRSYKRLLMVRGVKSMSVISSDISIQPKQIAGS
jgi:hypothetical protein